jgi:hypothetical protein
VDARAVTDCSEALAEDGMDVAREFQANQFILGSVVQDGNAFTLRATLYGSDGLEQTVARADFREDASIERAIDQVAEQLLQRRLEDSGSSAALSVTGTSGSYEAIKAYVEGMEVLRLGEFREACTFSRTSIMADSTYANACQCVVSVRSSERLDSKLSTRTANDTGRMVVGTESPHATTAVRLANQLQGQGGRISGVSGQIPR